MPRQDTITIHPHDLQKIINLLEYHQHTDDNVKIVDCGSMYIIRDSSDFLIDKVVKIKTVNS